MRKGMSASEFDKELYECGTVVFRTKWIRHQFLDIWLGEIVSISGQRVDWFFSGQSVNEVELKAMGDIERVRCVIKLLRNMHDAFFLVDSEKWVNKEYMVETLLEVWHKNKIELGL